MTISSLRAIKSWAAALRLPLRADRLPITRRETPPNNASPAAVARLTGHRSPWVASLAGFAQRGLLRQENEATSRTAAAPLTLCKHVGGDAGLTRYEQSVLEAIFQEDEGVPLAAVAPRLAWQATRLEEALESELMTSGWLDLDRRQQREKRLAFSVKTGLVGAAVLFGGLALAAGVSDTAWIGLAGILAVCGTGGLVLSAAALALGLAFSELSAEGERAAAQWKGFALFLKQALRGQSLSQAMFETYLPLAVALGLTKDLIQTRPSRGQPPFPAWFNVLATLRETGDWGAKLAVLTVTDAGAGETRPASQAH